jgi:DNA-binding transcriptional ArsR family regulator
VVRGPGVVHPAAQPLAARRDRAKHDVQGSGRIRRREVSDTLPFVETYQADGWTALGDPTRRAIFERLAERPRAVGELARELPVSRPAVSQHLKVLKNARLVVDQAAGSRRVYRLDPDGVGALRADLEQFWSSALAAYKAAVEQQPTKEFA